MRSNGNRFYLMSLAFVLMLSVVFSAQADSSYISIQEMQETTPSIWTENLKGGKKNFDCTIDAPIVIPEVERFPILLVDFQGVIPGLEATGYHVEDNTERLNYYFFIFRGLGDKIKILKTTLSEILDFLNRFIN